MGTAYRLNWGLPSAREKRPHRWLFLSSLALVTALLAGMAPHEIPDLDRLLEAAPPLPSPPMPSLPAPERKAPIPLRWPLALHGPERLCEHPVQVAALGTPRRLGGGIRQEMKVRHGDTLSHIFERRGLGKDQIHRVLSLRRAAAILKKLRVGQPLRIRAQGADLVELWYEQDATRSVHVVRDASGRLRAEIVVRKPQVRVRKAAGTVGRSLSRAARAAGLSDELVLRFMQIFRWDIDFALGIHQGDRFAVIYEELLRDGKRIKQGEILAAEFKSRGKSYRAIRFLDAEGRARYYNQRGEAVDRVFIRTPVQFHRISSHFNPRRRHPILHTLRAHKGVDYAAPQGTPVKATGDGKVQFAGTQGGYGTTLILDHGRRYTTLYAHLCRLAPGMKAGRAIRQGQVIGYVGSTGFATGPHLHYEFRVDGVHRNPLTVGLPGSPPLTRNDQRRFAIKARRLLAELDSLTSTRVRTSDRTSDRTSNRTSNRKSSARAAITTLARRDS